MHLLCGRGVARAESESRGVFLTNGWSLAVDGHAWFQATDPEFIQGGLEIFGRRARIGNAAGLGLEVDQG